MDGIILNSPSIERMLANQKINKDMVQEHSTSKAVKETCLPTIKEEWTKKSFKPTRQLAATVVYFLRKNLFKEANVELIAKELKLKKQQ